MSNNRLLIIDDEMAIAELIAQVGQDCGYETFCAQSGEQFRARHQEWRPTHIIVDLHMPGTDGIELIRFLAIQRSSAQILVMSGFDKRVLAAARRLVAERGLAVAGTLAKPIHVANLRALLETLKIPDGTIDRA